MMPQLTAEAFLQNPGDSTWSLSLFRITPPAWQYLYSPLPSSPPTIRLLRVAVAAKFSDDLHLEIKPISLDVKPHYAALSYTWGPPIFDHRIYLEEKPFHVTQSLDYALRCFRATNWQGGVIWADAICINQDDIDERTQQVRLMWDIYFRARMVLVSLGDGGSDGPVAVEFMQVRPDAWKRCYWTYKNAEVLKANGLLDDGAQEFEINMEERGAFDSLLLAPWIMRTWITQEAVACQDTRIMYAGDQVPIDALLRTLDMGSVGPAAFSETDIPWADTESHRRYALKWRAIKAAELSLHTLIYMKANPKSKTLLEIMRKLRAQLATDPRDKIFGLLELASDKKRLLQPDYRRTVEEVYAGLAVNVTSRPNARLGLLLAEAGLRKVQLNMPSWVPDWSDPVHKTSFCDKLWMNGESLRSVADDDTENTGNPSVARLPYSLSMQLQDPANLILTVRGAIEDIIVVLGPELELTEGMFSIQQLNFWNSTSRDLVREHYSEIVTGWHVADPESDNGRDHLKPVMMRFASALVGNMFDRKMPDGSPSRYAGKALEAWLLMQSGITAAVNGTDFTVTLSSRTPEQKKLCYIHDAMLFHISSGRRFCITGNGKMGLVPGLAEIGDVVAVIDGVRCPVILRMRNEDDDGFLFVGDSYIEKLDSEAGLEDRVADKDDIQCICIH